MCSIFGYECSDMGLSNRLTTLSVHNNLTVESGATSIAGTTTSINTNELEVKDNAIILNKGVYGSAIDTPSGLILEGNTNYNSILKTGNNFYFLNNSSLPDFKSVNLLTNARSNLYASNLNLNSLDVSKLLMTDSNKNLVSSTLSLDDIVKTNADQDVGGVKNFTGTVNCNTLNATNLIVTNTLTANNTDIKDPIVTLAFGNTGNVINTGLVGTYVQSSVTKYAGLMRYANDSKFYLIDQDVLPTVSTNLSTSSRASLVCGNLFSTSLNITGATATPMSISNVCTLSNGTLMTYPADNGNSAESVVVRDVYGYIYASNLNLSGLTASKLVLTGANQDLVSSSLGISDIVQRSGDQSIDGKKTFTSAPAIKGITDGSEAAAGDVGEYKIAPWSFTTTSTNYWYDKATLNLTPGDWEFTLQTRFYQMGGGTAVTYVEAAISTTAGNTVADTTVGVNRLTGKCTGNGDSTFIIVTYRVNITTPTTYYGKVFTYNYNCLIEGSLSVRRMR